MTAMHNPFFDLKFAVTLSLAIPAITVSLHLSRPEASLRGWAWLLLLPRRSACRRHRRRDDDAAAVPMMMRLIGKNSRVCMIAIPRCRCRCWRRR